MRTGIFAFLKSKKQAVNDSSFSFGKTVLEAVKNSKGTTEEELAGEMKGVLDSMSILKDCEAKTKLVDVVKDCFDNKEMAMSDETELVKTLDTMWVDIHSDSLGEIAKAFSKLSKKAEATDTAVKDSEDETEEDKTKDSKDESKEGEEKDSKDESKEGEEKDSKDEKEEKDGCHGNKDSALFSKEELISAVKDSLKPAILDAVKEVLGVKDSKAVVTGSEIDTGKTEDSVASRDYSAFLDK